MKLSGNNGPPDNVLSKAALKETGETLCFKEESVAMLVINQ